MSPTQLLQVTGKLRLSCSLFCLLQTARCLSLEMPTDNPVGLTITLKSNPLLCLDLSGGDDRNGSPLQVWECNGHQSQLWLFVPGSYIIQYAANPNKCIDAGALQQGKQLTIWDCNQQPQQYFGYGSDYTLFLSSSEANAQYCVDTYSPIQQGNALQVWSCADNLPQQQWSIMLGTSIRVDQNYHLCLDIPGGQVDDGAILQLWGCNGLKTQQWIVDGSMIRSGADWNKCIDAYSPMTAGYKLQIWDCKQAAQQAWGFDKTKMSLYLSQSMMSNASALASPFASFCMDVPGGQATQGTQVDYWNCNNCWNQHWRVAVMARVGDFSESVAKVPSPAPSPLQVGDDCPPKPGPSPPSPPGPIPPGTTPGEKYDLTGFKLQTCYKSAPREIKGGDLQKYSDARFFLDSDGAIAMNVYSNDEAKFSQYPRTEFEDTSVEPWKWGEGTHELDATVKILKVPDGKSIAFGQVHGFGDKGGELDMLLILRYDSDGTIEARVKNSDGHTHTEGDLGKVGLGEEINFRIRCEGKKVMVTVNSKSIEYEPPTKSVQTFYLKAGNYLQTNSGKEEGEVRFYSLRTHHEKSKSLLVSV